MKKKHNLSIATQVRPTETPRERTLQGKRHARLLEAVARLSKCLLELDIHSGLKAVVETIGPVTGADRAVIARFEWTPEDPEVLAWQIVEAEWARSDAVQQSNTKLRRFAMPRNSLGGLWNQALSGQSLFVIDQCPEPFRSEQKSLGVVWNLSVPIRVRGEVWGVIGFDHSTAVATYDPADRAVLEAASAAISRTIEREKIEAEKAEVLLKARTSAAEERAAELALSNEVLQRAAQRLAGAKSIDEMLDMVLHEAVAVTSAAAGVVQAADEANGYRIIAFFDDRPGEYLPPLRKLDARVQKMLSEVEQITVDEIAELLPESGKFHRVRGHQTVWHFPYRIGNRTGGFLGLAFRADQTPSLCQRRSVQALANLAWLAAEALRVSAEAREAELARERERASQAQIAALTRTNEVLRSTLTHLANDPDLHSFLMHLLEEAAAQTGAAAGHIFTYNATSNSLQLVAGLREGHAYRAGDPADLSYWSSPFPADLTPGFAWLCEHGSFLSSMDGLLGQLAWPGAAEWFAANRYNEAFCSALKAGSRPVGLLGLVFRGINSLQPEQVQLIDSLSNQAALAIHSQQLAEQVREHAIAREREKAEKDRALELARANQALQETLDALATEPDITMSLGHVLRAITEQLHSHSSALWLNDPQAGQCRVHLIYHLGQIVKPGSKHPGAKVWPVNRTLAWSDHVEQRRPVVYHVRTHQKITAAQRRFFVRLGVKSVLGVPLLVGTQVVGSFTVRFAEETEFNAQQLELVQALSHQATLAVQLTELARQAQTKAHESAKLEERNRLAREIHDTIAQGLTGVISQLEVVEETLTAAPEQSAQRVEKAKAIAKSSLEEARRSVWALHPPELEGSSLPDALRRFTRRAVGRSGPACRVGISGKPFSIRANAELEIYRVAHEAFRNALRHAGATKIDVRLQFRPGDLRLRVADNGRGMEGERSDDRATFGLTSMRERAVEVGGQLRIKSSPGSGTTVELIVPREKLL